MLCPENCEFAKARGTVYVPPSLGLVYKGSHGISSVHNCLTSRSVLQVLHFSSPWQASVAFEIALAY